MQAITDSGRVRAYVFGHVHQIIDLDTPIPILGTPSTCFQFEPGSEEFTVGSQQPGYRMLELDADGSLKSEVFRILDYELSLDLSQLQY